MSEILENDFRDFVEGSRFGGDAEVGTFGVKGFALAEPEAFHVFAPQWQPIFWNLADKMPEELLRTDNAWLHMLTVLRVEHEEAERFRAVC